MPDIGLKTQAKQHFEFLVLERGYRCTQSTPYRVRFESPTTFIALVYDGNRSYELDLLVGKAGSESSGNPSFSIAEILRLRQAPEAKQLSQIQVTSAEVLASFVQQLARALRTYGEDFIVGNEKSFVELSKQREAECKAYALESDLRRARAKAEAAWKKADYATVVSALNSLRGALIATEIAKLEFAEKQVAREGRKE